MAALSGKQADYFYKGGTSLKSLLKNVQETTKGLYASSFGSFKTVEG